MAGRTPGWAGGRNQNKQNMLLGPALRILSEHGDSINPVQALELLPHNMPVHSIRRYLVHAPRKSTALRRRNQICKNLMKLEHLQAMKAKATLQSRHAVITDDMVCQVCRRPFSTLSAPAIYPNMSIVHAARAFEVVFQVPSHPWCAGSPLPQVFHSLWRRAVDCRSTDTHRLRQGS